MSNSINMSPDKLDFSDGMAVINRLLELTDKLARTECELAEIKKQLNQTNQLLSKSKAANAGIQQRMKDTRLMMAMKYRDYV